MKSGVETLYTIIIISLYTGSEDLDFALSDINFRNHLDVAEHVVRLHQVAFPGKPYQYILNRFEAVEGMFMGRYPGYLPMDTSYHDIDHTFQTALCLSCLLVFRQAYEAEPAITEEDFDLALIAILLHDTGYLKEYGDSDGTGAKYTHVHEERSCRHARTYLEQQDWPPERIEAAQRLICCTGPKAKIEDIAFASERERLLGQAVCTADFVGQLSDRFYIEKLPNLFNEFAESFEHQGIAREDWPYQSFTELLRKTPAFYRDFVTPRMSQECGNLWHYLVNPTTGVNDYLVAIEHNIRRIEILLG